MNHMNAASYQTIARRTRRIIVKKYSPFVLYIFINFHFIYKFRLLSHF